MMKKLSVLIVVLCSLVSVAWGADGCDQHRLSREEFRAKQQAFITQHAGLTKEEADKFFPVYFELQDRKKQLNDEAWDLLRKGKDEKTTEAQYGEILEGVYDLSCKVQEDSFLQEDLSGSTGRDAFSAGASKRNAAQ